MRPEPETLAFTERHQGDPDGGMTADEGTQKRLGALQQRSTI